MLLTILKIKHFESVSLHELKDEVDNFDEELFDELVDNVTQRNCT